MSICYVLLITTNTSFCMDLFYFVFICDYVFRMDSLVSILNRKKWEVVEWWFYLKMYAASVMGTLICGGDTQTLLAVYKFLHSQAVGIQNLPALALMLRH